MNKWSVLKTKTNHIVCVDVAAYSRLEGCRAASGAGVATATAVPRDTRYNITVTDKTRTRPPYQ